MMAIGSSHRALKDSQSLAPRGFLSCQEGRSVAGKPPKSETVTQLRSKDGDEELTALFQEWLIAFEKTQSATGDEETVALLLLSRIESRIAATPAEGLRGIVVKLGLDRFLQEHADTASEQADSAYADLVRLTGHDPATEILTRMRSSGRQ
jgi:hypothetical protein